MVTLLLAVTPILVAILRVLVDDFGFFPGLKPIMKHIVLVERMLYLTTILATLLPPMYLESGIIEMVWAVTSQQYLKIW